MSLCVLWGIRWLGVNRLHYKLFVQSRRYTKRKWFIIAFWVLTTVNSFRKALRTVSSTAALLMRKKRSRFAWHVPFKKMYVGRRDTSAGHLNCTIWFKLITMWLVFKNVDFSVFPNCPIAKTILPLVFLKLSLPIDVGASDRETWTFLLRKVTR